MAGFKRIKSRNGIPDPSPKKLQMGASATVGKKDALVFSNGKLIRTTSQTAVVKYISNEDETSTATSKSLIDVIDPFGQLFEVEHTPLLNDVDANSGSTTTALVALTDATNSDMVGGIVYFPEQDEYRIITANTYSSNVVTITWVEPLPRAVAAGDNVRATAFGFGGAPKLDDTTEYCAISSVQADRTGGPVTVHEIDLKRKALVVSFNLA